MRLIHLHRSRLISRHGLLSLAVNLPGLRREIILVVVSGGVGLAYLLLFTVFVVAVELGGEEADAHVAGSGRGDDLDVVMERGWIGVKVMLADGSP